MPFLYKSSKYTKEEFDKAFTQLKLTGNPLIYSYFKSTVPDPKLNIQLANDLISFKKRLAEIGHFYTVYYNIEDLKYQFEKPLDRQEDKGFVMLQQKIKKETFEAITNYIKIKNFVIY